MLLKNFFFAGKPIKGMLLKGKNALITGGARGIGYAIVKKLAEEGCNVAFTFVSSVEKPGQVA